MLTKKAILASIGNLARKKYGMSYNDELIVSESLIQPLLESSESNLRKFASITLGRSASYGGHPDYNHLAKSVGQTAIGSTTALFFDLKNFTKYAKVLDLKKVYEAKAVSIEAVINVCYLYGGHLHEIPGDGVLMFFGGENCDAQLQCYYALYAAADSMNLLEEIVIPEYNSEEEYPDIYPKMGIDFGESLWGAYGASPNYEVKATSFYVDIASKMMNGCGSRSILVGDNLKTTLDIEDYFSKAGWEYHKQMTVNGKTVNIDYNAWEFDWKKFRSKIMKEDTELTNLLDFPQTSPIRSRTILQDAPLA